MNIYLIGYRCTGKTTLGKALALRLGRPFIDMDDAIVEQTGCSIAHMVSQEGWDFFRAKEKQILQSISAQKNSVVGTGGGVIVDKDNISVMRASGHVFWLRCRPETILGLMTADARSGDFRPALTSKGLLEEIQETLAAREPLYREAMDAEIATDVFDIPHLCDRIIAKLKDINQISN